MPGLRAASGTSKVLLVAGVTALIAALVVTLVVVRLRSSDKQQSQAPIAPPATGDRLLQSVERHDGRRRRAEPGRWHGRHLARRRRPGGDRDHDVRPEQGRRPAAGPGRALVPDGDLVGHQSRGSEGLHRSSHHRPDGAEPDRRAAAGQLQLRRTVAHHDRDGRRAADRGRVGVAARGQSGQRGHRGQGHDQRRDHHQRCAEPGCRPNHRRCSGRPSWRRRSCPRPRSSSW